MGRYNAWPLRDMPPTSPAKSLVPKAGMGGRAACSKLRLVLIAALSPLVHAGECAVQLYDDHDCKVPLNESRHGLPPTLSFDPLHDTGWPKCFLKGCHSESQTLVVPLNLSCAGAVPLIVLSTAGSCELYELPGKALQRQYYKARGCCNHCDIHSTHACHGGSSSMAGRAHFVLLGTLGLSWALQSL